MKKRMMLCLIAAVMVISQFGQTIPVSAAAVTKEQGTMEELEIVPGYPSKARLKYTLMVTNIIDVSGGIIYGDLSVTGYPSKATRIIAYAYLQKKVGSEYVTIGSFTQMAEGSMLDMSVYVGGAVRGATYRLKTSTYTYSGNEYENIINYVTTTY